MDGDNTNPAPNTGAPQGGAPTPAPAAADNTTLMGVLAYIGPLVIIPYLTAKDNPFVKFHIKQGLVLLVAEAILWVLGSMVYMLWMVLQFVNLGLFILAILGIVNVIQKKEAEVPLLGQFAKHFNF